MKIFFFIVLLANITFFLWEFTATKKQGLIDKVNSDTSQIVLLNELPVLLEELPESFVIADLVAVVAEGKQFKKDKLIKVITDIEPETAVISTGKLKGKNNSGAGILSASIEKEPLKNFTSKLNKIIEPEQQPLKNKKSCYQIGPFKSKHHINKWAEANSIDMSRVTAVSEEHKFVAGFLVYSPKAESYQESVAYIEEIKNKGITDFWLFRKGELKGDISFGLFSKESRAKRFRNEIKKKGVKVDIMPRYNAEFDWKVQFDSLNGIKPDMLKGMGAVSFDESCDRSPKPVGE